MNESRTLYVLDKLYYTPQPSSAHVSCLSDKLSLSTNSKEWASAKEQLHSSVQLTRLRPVIVIAQVSCSFTLQPTKAQLAVKPSNVPGPMRNHTTEVALGHLAP